MGGADAVVERANQDYHDEKYRWVAQVLNHVVFADPTHTKAKELLARTLAQLGQQCESGIWRNFYLTGAKELQEGVHPGSAPNTASPDIIAAMPTAMLFDYFAIRLKGLEAAESPMTLGLIFDDTNEGHTLKIKNGVLNYSLGKLPSLSDSLGESSVIADAIIRMNRSDLNEIIIGKTTFQKLLDSGDFNVFGDQEAFDTFLSLLDHFNFWFNIIEP
jgi:alkyl sulfatase BDS1-like metallo-beta-lactamase superfamily hydrolase